MSNCLLFLSNDYVKSYGFWSKVLSQAIDNTLPYGYETNHVSALISITSSSSILVSHANKDISWFVAINDDECLQVLQNVYTGGFMNYLLG